MVEALNDTWSILERKLGFIWQSVFHLVTVVPIPRGWGYSGEESDDVLALGSPELKGDLELGHENHR